MSRKPLICCGKTYLALYHEARVVTIVGKDGVKRPYRPTRYLNEIRMARKNNDLVPTVARMMRRKTHGIGILAAAGRRDLIVETRVVLDNSKPYHFPFSSTTVELARQRIRELEPINTEEHPGQRSAG